jgi:recombination protein RecT
MAATAQEIQSLAKRVTTVREFFDQHKQQIAAALPRHLSVDRLIRTAFTAFNTTPRLWECDRRSLFGAIVQCAQLGLEPGVLGRIYLVPFRNRKTGTTEVQVIIGYKGLVDLARRSGELSTVMAHEVRAGDAFRYRFGTEPELTHTPSEDAERFKKPITHFYAVARLKDGGVQFDVMTKGEVDAHRDRYSAAAKEGPWVTEYDEMGKKTVLRRLCKLLPASIELHTAVALDQQAEVQMPQNLGELAPPPDTDPSSRLGALTETLEQQRQGNGHGDAPHDDTENAS